VDALPLALRRRVRQFRRHSGPRESLVIHGLPAGREATVSAAVLTMVACGLGDPIAYLAEKPPAIWPSWTTASRRTAAPPSGLATTERIAGCSAPSSSPTFRSRDHRPQDGYILTR